MLKNGIQITMELQLIGYIVEHLDGGFKKEPFERTSAEMVWTLKAIGANHARF